MNLSSPWLVLFDVDGTLVHTGRAGVRGMNAAFERLYGAANALEGTTIAGRTDRGIVADVLVRLGREATDAAIAELREAYLSSLRVEILRPVASPKQVLPGAVALLDALAARPDIHVGLLTGNFEGGAMIKLEYFDLWRRFGFGAFGDVHTERRPLVPLAVARAGVPVDRTRTVIVGDTPLDVDCARAYGARAVAVATGPFDAAALRAAGADLVIDTLEATGVDALLGP